MNQEEILRAKIRNPRSREEIRRRVDLTLQAMKEEDVDLIIAQNDNKYLGGYVRWFLDIPAVQGYPMTVMLDKEGNMTSITHGAPDHPLLPEWALRYPVERLSSAYIRTLDYTNPWDAQLISAKINECGAKRIGLVGDALINHVICDHIRDNTTAEIINFTRQIDKIKSPKSREELEQGVMVSGRMHDEVMDYIAQILKPGMKEYELQLKVIAKLLELGSEEQLVMIGSGPANVCAPIQYTYYQNRTIEKGDAVVIMVETSGCGGYFCEISRPYIVGGKPSEELVRLFDQSKEVQRRTAQRLKPGMMAGSITDAVNVVLEEMDLPRERRIFTHGQGYDLIESPGFAEIDDTVLQENMNIAVHPTYVTEKAFGFCCDNYLVTAAGGVRVETFPQEIIML